MRLISNGNGGIPDGFKGFRRPGLHIPGKWAGTFSREGTLSFWNVGTPGRTVVVELTGERYQRLFLSVEDPRALVDAINAAVPR